MGNHYGLYYNFFLIFRDLAVPSKLQYHAGLGRSHGNEPKCIRIKELHHLLFYLVYGYSGLDDADQNEMKVLLKSRHHHLDDDMLKDIPQIYLVLFIYSFYFSI